MDESKKKILKVIGFGILAYTGYRLVKNLSSKKKVIPAVSKTVDDVIKAPVELPKKIIDKPEKTESKELQKEEKEHPSLPEKTVKQIVKDHQKKKYHKKKRGKKMKKISPCKNCGKETYNTTKEFSGFCSADCEKSYKKHKGHKTKRGLRQDQKRRSKEDHEKSYQKRKKR